MQVTYREKCAIAHCHRQTCGRRKYDLDLADEKVNAFFQPSATTWQIYVMANGRHISSARSIDPRSRKIDHGLFIIMVQCVERPRAMNLCLYVAGDFAVLLNAGMSVRQALFYNLVSSILSFVGMVIGVLLGNVGSASAWIFGLTAGIFIYISLVDMVSTTLCRFHLTDEKCGVFLYIENNGLAYFILTGPRYSSDFPRVRSA